MSFKIKKKSYPTHGFKCKNCGTYYLEKSIRENRCPYCGKRNSIDKIDIFQKEKYGE